MGATEGDAPAGSAALPQFGPQSITAAIEAIKKGGIIVVTDDESRENEGDLIMAAEYATPETIGFFVRYTSGVICVSVSADATLPLPREGRGQTAAAVHRAGQGQTVRRARAAPDVREQPGPQTDSLHCECGRQGVRNVSVG